MSDPRSKTDLLIEALRALNSRPNWVYGYDENDRPLKSYDLAAEIERATDQTGRGSE